MVGILKVSFFVWSGSLSGDEPLPMLMRFDRIDIRVQSGGHAHNYIP